MPTNPFDSPVSEPVKRSRTKKWFVGGGIGCGLLVVFCCGGFGIVSFLTGNYTARSATNDPEEIHRFVSRIASLQVPEDLLPRFGIQISVSGNPTQTAVVFAAENMRDSLAIGQFDTTTPELAGQQLNLLLGDAAPPREDLQILKSTREDRQIRGRAASFIIAEGVGVETETKYWRVDGRFFGKSGSAVLNLQVRQADFPKQRINEFIESIK